MFHKERPRRAEAGGLNPADFDALYGRYKNAVYSFACYLTRDQKEAEDLFQETWLRVVQHRHKISIRPDLKTWILTIMINLHRDALRKKRIRSRFTWIRPENSESEPEAADPFWSKNVGPNDLYERTEAHRAITKALAGLPENQRSVFVLKEIQGFKHSEISEILKVPVGTVKSLLFRAVRCLQGELEIYNSKKSASQEE